MIGYVIIPMMGKSSRFFSAGYKVPKFQLMVNGESLFTLSVKTFVDQFQTHCFIFVFNEEFGNKEFVTNELLNMGIKNYKILTINGSTLGQAHTVFEAIKDIVSDDELTIFNIDTAIKNYSDIPLKNADGLIDVFVAEGDGWSFVVPGSDDTVVKTTEKVRVSDLCSNGLYKFRSVNLFKKIFLINNYSANYGGEIYIAPLYNIVINNGGVVKYNVRQKSNVVLSGTPVEYEALISK